METSQILLPRLENCSLGNCKSGSTSFWQPPSAGTLKINVDDGFISPNKASFGFLERDSEGVCWMIEGGPTNASSALVAEAKALYEAILFVNP
uniref:RNase H type-1 domain-containing protein n=1 Tax=Nelumbo nucifera TaxID=4432 RepID=A0A822ZE26_NELNU|nr:TPA_asm: hypothetical protein HUJ06_000980 [Nelumbo nucifera]